jgi:hypothetical protein
MNFGSEIEGMTLIDSENGRKANDAMQMRS